MDDIKVLIVDDSALMRSLIGKIVDGTAGLTVADKAMNGRFALQKLDRVQPDIIVLDLEMPEMNGIEFLRERKKLKIDIPVIILSSIAKEGARVTMDCLELGASDFVTKPSGSESANLATVASQLVEFLQAYGRQYQLKKQAASFGILCATLCPYDPFADNYSTAYNGRHRFGIYNACTTGREADTSAPTGKT